MSAIGQKLPFAIYSGADMFEWLNKQGVKSDQGFEVQFTGRFTLEYREGIRKITVTMEDGNFGGGPSISMPRNALERWDNSAAPISHEKRIEIRENLKAALAFQDISLESN